MASFCIWTVMENVTLQKAWICWWLKCLCMLTVVIVSFWSGGALTKALTGSTEQSIQHVPLFIPSNYIPTPMQAQKRGSRCYCFSHGSCVGQRLIGRSLQGCPLGGSVSPSSHIWLSTGEKSPLLLCSGPAPVPAHLARPCRERCQTHLHLHKSEGFCSCIC